MHRRRFVLPLLAVLASGGLLLSGCGDDEAADDGTGGTDNRTEITIASQAFPESEILAQIYGQVFNAAGYPVEYQTLNDRAAIYAAFDSGDIDFEPDYAASAVEFLNGNQGEASPDVDDTVEKLQARLEEKNLKALEASKAVDSNSLVVTKATYDKGITKISDLTEDLKLGGPQDCPSNAGCIPALEATYGLDMTANFVPLDASGPNTVAALREDNIDVAVIFSTDPAIAVNGWKVLEDDKGIFNADNIIPVTTEELAGDPELVALADKVSAALTTENLTALVKRAAVDKEDPEDVAADFIEEAKLK